MLWNNYFILLILFCVLHHPASSIFYLSMSKCALYHTPKKSHKSRTRHGRVEQNHQTTIRSETEAWRTNDRGKERDQLWRRRATSAQQRSSVSFQAAPEKYAHRDKEEKNILGLQIPAIRAQRGHQWGEIWNYTEATKDKPVNQHSSFAFSTVEMRDSIQNTKERKDGKPTPYFPWPDFPFPATIACQTMESKPSDGIPESLAEKNDTKVPLN